jgi:hypothetical protein
MRSRSPQWVFAGRHLHSALEVGEEGEWASVELRQSLEFSIASFAKRVEDKQGFQAVADAINVNPSRSPKGVEHSQSPYRYARASSSGVNPSRSPKGVEHSQSPYRYARASSSGVNPSMSPKGVEHKASPA